MAPHKTGITTYDLTVLSAESTRQSAITPASTAAQVKTAEVAFYRACVTAALAASPAVSVVPFTNALRDLGTGGT